MNRLDTLIFMSTIIACFGVLCKHYFWVSWIDFTDPITYYKKIQQKLEYINSPDTDD